jgi:hypothetical protein
VKVTRKMLEALVSRINAAHGLPDKLYLTDSRGFNLRDEATGALIPNAGAVYLTGIIGGWRIEKMCQGGGSSDFLHASYESKKIVYLAASAYLKGFLEAGLRR